MGDINTDNPAATPEEETTEEATTEKILEDIDSGLGQEQGTMSEEEGTQSEKAEDLTEELKDEQTVAYKFKVDGKTVEMSPEEFERFYKDWRAEKKWQAKLHEKGQKLNRLRDELQAKEAEIKANEAALQEWKKVRAAIEANPQAYAYLQKLLNENEPSVDPTVKKLEERLNELDSSLKEKEAYLNLSKKYEDFNKEEIENFAKDIDWSDREQVLEALYLAWKGSQLDDLIEKARAEVVMEAKKKKGLPPTGKKEKAPEKEYNTIWEAAEAAKAAIMRGEIQGEI